MTDHFELAMAEIARKALKNGGVTNEHIIDALRATNDDLDEKTAELAKKVEQTHVETRKWHESVSNMVHEHIAEDAERDRRIDNLELAEEDRRENCVPLMKSIASEMHQQTHAEYVASLGQSKFQQGLVWFFASAFGKLALVLLGGLGLTLINLLIYGRP